jgi:molybdate transport repressor ModE-like protein
MLDLRRLEILCAVARTGSLAGAARELSYSTPAVWQHMKRLEAEAGHPLLTSHARGVRLTPAGEILVRHGEQLLRRMARAVDELAALDRLELGTLRIAAFATAGAGLLPEPLARFREAHPGVRVSLREADPAEALRGVRDGEIDVALVFATPGTDAPTGDIQLVHVIDDPLYVLLPADHPLASAEQIAFEQLRTSRWLRGRYAFGEPAGGGGAPDAEEELELAYRGGDYRTVERLVAAGTGLALVPRLALGPLPSDLVARPLLGDPHVRRIDAATPGGPVVNVAAQRFLELLQETAEQLAASWRTPPQS